MDLGVARGRDLDAKPRAQVDERRSLRMHGESARVLRDFGRQLANLQCSGPERIDDEFGGRFKHYHRAVVVRDFDKAFEQIQLFAGGEEGIPGYPARAFGPSMLMLARDARNEVEVFATRNRPRIAGRGGLYDKVAKTDPSERRQHGAERVETKSMPLPVNRIESMVSARETVRFLYDYRQNLIDGGLGIRDLWQLLVLAVVPPM